MPPTLENSAYFHLDMKIEDVRKELAEKIDEMSTQLTKQISVLIASKGESTGRQELIRWAAPLAIAALQLWLTLKGVTH